MARLVVAAVAVLIWSISGPAKAADAPSGPWNGNEERRPAQNYDIPDEADIGGSRMSGSRIIAGTEVMPNTMVGFGMFGQKAEKTPHAASTARELALPKSRKAAVGLSFKF